MKNSKQSISILGCGWVGKALCSALSSTYHFKTSVQSQASFETLDCSNKFILNAQNDFNQPSFYQSDVLIISIPPRGDYLGYLTSILKYIKPKTQLILLSSTSVYSQTEGVVYEEDSKEITYPSLMLQGERLVQKHYPTVVILRLGGLMGYKRIAGKYTAGKSLPHDAPINYVHRDDVIEVINQCIEQQSQSIIFNVVAPLQIRKKELYDYNATRYGFEKTDFETLQVIGKRVDGSKIEKILNVHFQFQTKESICSTPQ